MKHFIFVIAMLAFSSFGVKDALALERTEQAKGGWCTCACSGSRLVNVCATGEISDPTCMGPCLREDIKGEIAYCPLEKKAETKTENK